jgi:23S rRNA (uridine2552-2'-O)-methyltransferase
MATNRRRPDHWTKKAKAAGFSARSVYKLEEIQRRERMLPRKGQVVDLGCCPGSWSQYLRRSSGNAIRLVGIDLSDTTDYPGLFLQDSALTIEPARIMEALSGQPADLVMSDMAPNTEGHRFTDHIRQIELARAALRIAVAVLKPGGDFIVKVFEGEEAPDFVSEVRPHFAKVRRIKPEATRRESVEFFVVARGFCPEKQEKIG